MGAEPETSCDPDPPEETPVRSEGQSTELARGPAEGPGNPSQMIGRAIGRAEFSKPSDE